MALESFQAWIGERAGFYRELPDYFRGLKKTAIQEIFYGESVLMIIFAIYTYVYSISLSSVLLMLAGSFMLAGYHIWRADHLRLIPGIKLEEVRQQPAPGKDEKRTYVQLVLSCATEAPIEECNGRLLRVWRWSGDDWGQIEPNQPLHLNWSPGVDQPITLSPYVPELLDVFYLSDRVSYVYFCSGWIPLRARTIDVGQPSILKFEIAINGRDADSHKSLPTLLISLKVDVRRWPVINSIEQLSSNWTGSLARFSDS